MSVELVQTRISPDLLDTIGKSFKFRHGNGVAEWLKNALDNYLRRRATGDESRAGGWPVVINLLDAPSGKYGPNLAVVDFGGTTLQAIDEFFLLWGSSSAASLGRQFDDLALTGGHGNGGKFYMRQMWKDGARFLTFLNGRATSLVVQRRDDGNSGYWEFKERETLWREAFELGLPESEHLGGGPAFVQYLEEHNTSVVEELDAGVRGFTLLAGRRAAQILSSNDVVRSGRWDRQRLVDAIRDAPQARRPLREVTISILANGAVVLERLVPDPVDADPEWPVETVELPGSLMDSAGADASVAAGSLVLLKAASPLTGRQKERNGIAILDAEGNPLASYPVKELPLPGHSPALDFIHGEVSLTFRGTAALTQNDRERLVPSPATTDLLDWVSDQIWLRIAKLEESRKSVAQRDQLELASLLNDELNRHAKRFLEELQTQIFVDVVEDPEGGGPGSAHGDGHRGEGGEGTGGQGSGGRREVSGTTEKSRRPRFPQVLLSGYDPDPATGGTATKNLTDRHPPLDQDDIDKQHNVWWINTEHVFARAAMQRGGAKGLAFRSYQLHMFRDVVQREALRYRQRREAELSLDRVENELTEMSNKFLGELPHALVSELLD